MDPHGLSQDPAERAFHETLAAALRDDAPVPPGLRADALAYIRAGLAEQTTPTPATRAGSRDWRRPGGAIAAAVTALALAFVWHDRGAEPGDAGAPSNGAIADYRTRPGQRASMTLADGSRMTLGPATTARVRVAKDGAVDVAVDGEASFAVKHDTRRPFLVRAGRATARVLGTEFLVQHYATDRDARILVVEGRVQVAAERGGASAPAILGASAMGTVTDSGAIRVEQGIPAERYAAWMRGALTFENVPVSKIVTDLGRAYDVEIRLADSALAKRVITWRVETERYPLTRALRELTELLDAHVVRSGKILTLAPGRGAVQRTPSTDSPFVSKSYYGR